MPCTASAKITGWTTRNPLASLSDDEVFGHGLAAARIADDDGDHGYWACVVELNRNRATRAIFDRAVRLASQREPAAPCFDIDVLNEVGFEQGCPYQDDSVTVLSSALDANEVEVVTSALAALSKFAPSTARDRVIAFHTHSDDRVRFACACALPRFASDNLGDDDPVAAALIELMKDADFFVRDWATMGLGSQTSLDGVQIRNALVDRLDDQDAATRDEAISSLARRHDRSVFPAITKALAAESVSRIVVGAAAMLADERLLPLLEGGGDGLG